MEWSLILKEPEDKIHKLIIEHTSSHQNTIMMLTISHSNLRVSGISTITSEKTSVDTWNYNIVNSYEVNAVVSKQNF
jgi:hypothetical protein